MGRKSNRDKATATIVTSYDKDFAFYDSFTVLVKELLTQLLSANEIPFHSVTHRTKTRESLKKKLSKPSKNYGCLTDITDLCGIRITTYFEDDATKIATMIEREFLVDHSNSINKSLVLDPDRFGYLSLHQVVQLNSARKKLAEYKRYSASKVEIQTRSILQHAWAEIEHDLGYKNNLSIPAEVRRRFARLAGLLELADNEFTGIRNQLDLYQKSIPVRINEEPNSVGIDKSSLQAFAYSESIAKILDHEIAAFVDAKIYQDEDYLEDDAEYLTELGINTIHQLDDSMRRHSEDIKLFAREWLKDGNYTDFCAGISIFYLWYVLLAESGNAEFMANILVRRSLLGSNDEEDLVERLLHTYQSIKAS